ncbi:MAG: ATP-binding cassette domain-containing protein, partial [Proteobacteria bacterium]|nr:ATP-binding cassette domain-containing protein [Pseudomonadota bacterium]
MTDLGDRIEMSGLEIQSKRRKRLVHDVSFALRAGELIAMVGASGSGKTLSSRALLGIVDFEPGVVAAELRIVVGNQTFCPYAKCLGKGRSARDRAFAPIRGGIVGYLAQDAPNALDPMWTVGRHVSVSAALNPKATLSEPYP